MIRKLSFTLKGSNLGIITMSTHSIPAKKHFVRNRNGKYTYGGIQKGIQKNCVYNEIIEDGLSWCVRSVGSWYHAGQSCLCLTETQEGVQRIIFIVIVQ